MEIKDAILEILLDKVIATPISDISGLPQSAREIAEMMSEFIEWTSEYYFDGTRWCISQKGLISTDELFTYWKETVYKKQ